ncbi:hypothetical protein M569_05217, partial [Genlisea aurea]
KLSKSQKRKLKKMQEEKEKEMLLLESMEALEKYRIRDDVYSLMWSSRNLGQVETLREKRRREFEFSKAGLELPESDHPLKKKKSQQEFETFEQCEDGVCSPVSGCGRSAFPTCAPVEFSGRSVGNDEAVASDGDVADEVTQPKEQKLQKCSHIEEVSNSKHIKDISLNDNQNHRNGSGHYPSRDLITPTVVHVTRPADVEKKRKDLPIVMMEQEIMEAINENISVIICGETGCGKTTQVPQFLYEAGYGSSNSNGRSGTIGITQPRRVAVLATARRVAFELGVRLGKEVGFQVRHDRRVGENCSIKFMTDGILLREVQSDFLLKRYSILILDEAHERSVNTDILVGMLSRVIRQRQREYEEQQRRICAGEVIDSHMRVYPLKLVLMSATLCVEDFISGGRIFQQPPPVIEVPTRQYPVTIHFSKRTETVDYVGQAFKKVMSIHKRLPPGGILVFVTGQREVEYLCQKLRRASREIVSKAANAGSNASSFPPEGETTENGNMEDVIGAFESQGNNNHEITERFGSHVEDDGVLSEDEAEISYNSEEESDLDYSSDDDDKDSDGKLVDVLGAEGTLNSLKAAFEALSRKNNVDPDSCQKEEASTKIVTSEPKPIVTGAMCVLPLYAMLPASSQLRVFEDVEEGVRLVVVATNVAETSLTIPGIKYVVDTGREKVKNYSASNGMETYEIQWVSKASASQRAGRAGRTGPGHCYRLYSSAVYSNHFSDFSKADILKTPVDGVVLLMKSMNIGKASCVANFPFPTPPDRTALIEAEHSLKVLEALDEQGAMTAIGKAMTRFPMSPRHSKMLLTVIRIVKKGSGDVRPNLVLAYAVAAASSLSLNNPFQMHFEKDDAEDDKKKLRQRAKTCRQKFFNPTSDALSAAFALSCFELSENPTEFCSENSLHHKIMEEMSKLRKQLLHLVFVSSDEDSTSWSHGTISDVESAWRVESHKSPLRLSEEDILRRAICSGWADRVAKRVRVSPPQLLNGNDDRKMMRSVKYEALTVKEPVFLHRRSSLSRTPPEYLVYSELLQSERRPYLHGATAVKPEWLVEYGRALCSFSAPLRDPKPFYDSTSDQVLSWAVPSFGSSRHRLWQLPIHPQPVKDESERAAVFGFSLLRGDVITCMRGAKKY